MGDLPNLKVSTFHALCADVAARAGVQLRTPDGSPGDERLFREEFPLALRRGLESLPDERYDAVLVDEGQDFPSSWFPVVEQLLRDPVSSRLFVFHDDNQRVRPMRDTVAAHVPRGAVRLKRILRNGKRIVEQLDPLLPKPYTPDAPDGSPVEWHEVPATLTPADVERVLQDLIETRRIRPDHIAVLVSDDAQRKQFVSRDHIGRYRVTDAESAPSGLVYCDTIRRFKGLERQVVVVIEPEREIGSPEMLYVALTRARVLLVLLASRGRLRQLGDLLNRARGLQEER
jgi:superfamily I DNA/RNA helicase